jgi:hypothetical protein
MVGSTEIGGATGPPKCNDQAMAVGHGHTSVAVDSADGDAPAVRRALFCWLADFGDDVQIEAPTQDAERLGDLDALGFTPLRSSFELERPGDRASRIRRGPMGSCWCRSVSVSTTRNSTR